MKRNLVFTSFAFSCIALCVYLHAEAICSPVGHKNPRGPAHKETQKVASQQLRPSNGRSNTARDPADYVDPRIGVLDEGSNCVIGPQLPSGSINPSPQTPSGSHDGYSPTEPIRGFGQLHVSGTGWGKYGQVFISPQLGVAVEERGHDSPKADERAAAYEYSVTLTRYHTRVEVTPARHSAIYRLTFPTSDSASVLIDLTHNIPMDIAPEVGGRVSAGEISIDSSREWTIRGSGTYRGGFGQGDYQVFFCAVFDTKPSSFGTWSNGRINDRTSEARIMNLNDRIGAFLTFTTTQDKPVEMKIAVSLKSTARAAEWLTTEIPRWDYTAVRGQAKASWNKELRKIEVEGGSDTLKTLFYTALYHAMLMPRDRTSDIIGYPDGMPLWDDQYAVWDTWRTVFPLMTLLNPQMVAGNVNSFIARYGVNGKVKDSFIAGIDMDEEQGGNDIDNIIADAFVKGVPGIDWNAAYRLIKHDAQSQRKGWEGGPDSIRSDIPTGAYRTQGWISANIMSCSKTLEYAYNDFCASQMAARLDTPGVAARYAHRSGLWTSLWNPDATSDGYKGFIVPRSPDGQFVPIDPKKNWGSWKENFYEGSSWTYSYFVPHQFPRLVRLCGGKRSFAGRLEHALENNLVDYSNEPAFLAMHAFHYADRPDLASRWVRELMRSGYSLRGYPGNDDSGAMGSWYVFGALGFFPNAGQPLYYLHGPSFSKITVHLAQGKTLTIVGQHASSRNIYVQSLGVNGKPYHRSTLPHALIKDGGTLNFVMGPEPRIWTR
ncbi:MAG TPA: GH92 family glycosyl hydrolase [Bacteroidota bacterium]|nr:GH92 family glycosyl hydrolase [Bacteroidota bacterium]